MPQFAAPWVDPGWRRPLQAPNGSHGRPARGPPRVARAGVDLSLDIYPGMTALGGAGPTVWTRASHELTAFFHQGALSYQTTSMLLSEHAGTHIDAPYHFDPDGAAIEAMSLDRLFARARMLDLTAKRPLEGIDPEDLDAALRRLGEPIEPGDAAVVWTDHSRNYERPDYTHHRPFITAEGAAWLTTRRPSLVATDLVGLDAPIDHVTPVHHWAGAAPTSRGFGVRSPRPRCPSLSEFSSPSRVNRWLLRSPGSWHTRCTARNGQGSRDGGPRI